LSFSFLADAGIAVSIEQISIAASKIRSNPVDIFVLTLIIYLTTPALLYCKLPRNFPL
jgi:hypothetical protein